MRARNIKRDFPLVASVRFVFSRLFGSLFLLHVSSHQFQSRMPSLFAVRAACGTPIIHEIELIDGVASSVTWGFVDD